MMEEEDTDSSVHTGQVGNRTASEVLHGGDQSVLRNGVPASTQHSVAWHLLLCAPGAQAC